jgi:hypothetical protein
LERAVVFVRLAHYWRFVGAVLFIFVLVLFVFSSPAKGEKGAPLAEYLAGIHPEDVERITQASNRALSTGEKYIQEYRLLKLLSARRTDRRVQDFLMLIPKSPKRFGVG